MNREVNVVKIRTIGFWMLLSWSLPGLIVLFVSPDGSRFTVFNLYHWWGLLYAAVFWVGAICYEWGYRRQELKMGRKAGNDSIVLPL